MTAITKSRALQLAIESIDQMIYQIPFAIYQTTNENDRERLRQHLLELQNSKSLLEKELQEL